ncbi:MAG: hypothetical protein DWQ02_07400 [Bacteroidetes bacterium]|nr:MAG: hypothetical protein DWQ02_07400 [Bacteroidota bacterium]
MLKKIFFTFLGIMMTLVVLQAQDSMGVDTTDIGYKIGYKIGSYLPVTVLILIALFFIRRAYRFKEK